MMTSKEALAKLYEEREYAYADKVNNKGITWSDDITHYDNIGKCLNVIKNDLELLEEIKKAFKNGGRTIHYYESEQ